MARLSQGSFLSGRRCGQSHDGPDEPGEFSGYGSHGDVGVLSLRQSPVSFRETVLGLDRDRDDLRWLARSPALEDEGGSGSTSMVVSRFDEHSTGEDISCLRDRAVTLSVSGRGFARNESGPGHELFG